MIGRALRRRCPRCGGRGWFRGWFAKGDRCVSCGYKYERQDGFLLGALTINTIVTLGCVLAMLIGGLIATSPDFETLKVTLACVALGATVPVIMFPFSYTVWAAIDLAMRPMEPAEEADALTWLAARGPDDSRR